MPLHNLMEEIVRGCLKEWLHRQPDQADYDEAFQSDVMAITLNNLPPKYVSTDRGEMIAKVQFRLQVETDVNRELSLAIHKLLNAPRKSIFEQKKD